MMTDNEPSGRILVVEDDPAIVELLKGALSELGVPLDTVSDGLSAVDQILTGNYSLIILDLNLPGLGGFEICRRVRHRGQLVPILILSSRTDEVDKVLGLQLGADDFVSKPFGVRELVARVVALLRRSHLWSHPKRASDEELIFEELAINPRERSVTLRGELVDLSPIEFDLLYTLAADAGRVFSKEDLLRIVWGQENTTYLNVIGPHVSRLRAKIETNPSDPCYVKTDWGVGYFFGVNRPTKP